MADQNSGQPPINNDDIVGHINGSGNDVADALRKLAEAIDKDPSMLNRGARATRESQSNFASKGSKWKLSRNTYRSTGNFLDDFENGIRDQLLDSLAGGSFKKGMERALTSFTKEFGMSLNQVPHALGKQMVKSVMGEETSKKISAQLSKSATNFLGRVFDGKGADGAAAKKALTNVIGNFFGNGEVAAGAAETGNAMAGLTAVASSAVPVIAGLAIAIGIASPAIEGFGKLLEATTNSATRQESVRKKASENAQKRLEADMKYMAEEPFNILTEAAKKWEQTWDANLAKVALTQGYTKEDTYDLYENIASRLISEGLGSAIPATDVINNLGSILDAGLSGRVAEEFAYISTKLSAAIPTENFTGYASTYAQLASEAMSRGMSESGAINYANEQLELFASNLLYSSRNLAGGFTTGLKDASSLFKDAVDIAQTSKTGDAALISGTLTSVSAIVGSVAPDLASGLVQNIVSAATGGNADSLVALRSLAGVNAGNTAFLKELANDPQGLFVTIFRNLANMQNMSPDNYMEVAEGLSSIFGVDMKAFARVDFNALADRVADMSISTTSLGENMNLLASGEATMSTEQLKLQEINNQILEEGLAYVIDSEAGRMIQQHMWDEQLANEIENTTFAVEIQGAALQFLEGIRETITNLLNFLNPIGYIANGVANMEAATKETEQRRQDIADILQLGAVGANQKSLTNLVTVGQDLALTRSLIEMMGGTSNVTDYVTPEWVNNVSKVGAFLSPGGPLTVGLLNATYGAALTGSVGGFYSGSSFNDKYYGGKMGGILGYLQDNTGYTDINAVAGQSNSTRNSMYSGFSVGKSVYNAIQGAALNSNLLGSVPQIAFSATQNATEASNKKFQEFLNSAEEASKTMSYDAWVQTSKSFGISNFTDALEMFGQSEEKIRGYFEANQAREGAIKEENRKADEQLFRDENRAYWDYESGSNGVFQTAMWLPFFGDGMKYDVRMDAVDTALTDIQTRIGVADKFTVISGIEDVSRKIGDDSTHTVIGILTQIHGDITTTFISTSSLFQRCLADWTRYIAESKEYTSTVSKSTAWNDFKAAEADQQTQATLALANALGVFSADELKKMDPQLQTNALLGEIVIILQSIMQQNNNQVSGMGLIDTISALGLGVTTRQQ
jgi:hypothetical protein